MSDFRVFCEPVSEDVSELQLSSEESHHLVVVNRARRGDTVIGFNGRGREWTTELVAPEKRAARLRVLATTQAPPLPYEITLGMALPKGQSMDGIVRKATELGTAVIVPLESERTQVHLEAERQDKKLDKWKVAALEAAKQCGNPWLPTLRPIQSAADFMSQAGEYDLKLIASLHPGARLLKGLITEFRSARGGAPRKVLWLIGPEGDFSPAEIHHAVAHGFQPVTLGPLVLRCETAATFALSATVHELLGG